MEFVFGVYGLSLLIVAIIGFAALADARSLAKGLEVKVGPEESDRAAYLQLWNAVDNITTSARHCLYYCLAPSVGLVIHTTHAAFTYGSFRLTEPFFWLATLGTFVVLALGDFLRSWIWDGSWW